jgi:S1-C subfamily serine protease
MTSPGDWQIAPSRRPQPEDYQFDLDRALASVVGLRATVAADAFTAETLGTERAGNGVFIRDGVVLTIGYLITEAEEVWLHLDGGQVVPGHALAYDQPTGFGLVQALAHIEVPPLPLGNSAAVPLGSSVIVAGAGGRSHSVAARVVAKQEFAGYWEYVLDEAIFTAPAHPLWGGSALISSTGDLLGIGSLQVEHRLPKGETGQLNVAVPVDILKPILDDLLATGRANRPPRPWLGVFATEIEGKVFIAGFATGGPAEHAGLQMADLVVAVGGEKITNLAAFFRAVWALGQAGVEVPLIIHRDGRTFEVRVASADRNDFLRAPRMHS